MNTHLRSCRLKVSASVVVATVFAAAALAEEQGEWKAPARAVRMQNPVTADQNSIAAGQAVYMKECRACHGQQGKGDGPGAADLSPQPDDLSSSSIAEMSDGEMFWKISTGRKPMPGFDRKLSEQQRWSVVNFVRTLASSGQKGDSK